MSGPALGRLGLVLWILASVRHRFFWGGDLAPFLHLLETAALGLGGFLLYRGARKSGGLAVSKVFRETALWCLLAAIALPILSDDALNYAVFGRVLGLHGANPYLVTPEHFAGIDPAVGLAKGWAAFPLPYGPLLALLQAAASWTAALVPGLGPEAEVLGAAFLLQLCFAAAWFGCGLCFGRNATGREAALLLVANPYLLLEAVENGHNDALMVLPLLGAFLTAERGKLRLAGFLLGIAVLLKFIPLLLLPLFLREAHRRGRLRAFCAGAALGLLGLLPSWYVFWRDPGGFEFLAAQTFLEGGSIVGALCLILGGEARPALALVSMGLAGAFALLQAFRLREGGLARRGLRSLAFLVTFGLPFPNPWYALWWAPLTLCPGIPRNAARRLLSVLALCGPLSYAAWLLARDLGPVHQGLQYLAGILIPGLLALRLPGTEGETGNLRPSRTGESPRLRRSPLSPPRVEKAQAPAEPEGGADDADARETHR